MCYPGDLFTLFFFKKTREKMAMPALSKLAKGHELSNNHRFYYHASSVISTYQDTRRYSKSQNILGLFHLRLM